ncbi:MAG: 3-deoxy-D-manno-octulosonic acid transferase [Phycisphaerales bacterium]
MNALDLLYITGGAALSPWLLRKQRAGWKERFGNIPPLPAKGLPRLMIHTVSVGEVNAIRHLLPLLVSPSAGPQVEVVVTVGTDTGLARATELFCKHATVLRYPIDLSASVRRFLDAVQPDAVALVELEVWPNFIKECSRRQIPVAVINGRLSERSFKGYRKLKPVLAPTFARLAEVAAQDEDYAARFIAMGVPRDRVRISGTMKWDAAVVPESPDAPIAGAGDLATAFGIDRARPLIVAGSTGPEEEALLHRVCPSGAQLLCAPRKPERFEEAASALPGCIRRSTTKGASTPSPSGRDRFLLDTIGELRLAYSLADVIVIGRSFFNLFGSDPLEPAALGKPILIGPRYGDFQNVVQTLERAGAIRIVDSGHLAPTLASLLNDATERAELSRNARAAVLANKGASAKHAEMLVSLLKPALTRTNA